MYRPIYLAFLVLFSLCTMARANAEIGFREMQLDPTGDRPLHVALWYPTAALSGSTIIGENPAFIGAPAIRNATPKAGTHALILLSHGDGGNWRNQSWLASQLARQGYIVAAPDHPGTTSFNMDPIQAARLWQRPLDLSRIIDRLVADPTVAGRIDARRIAAIGHSLGGWTVAALAGARFDRAKFADECQKYPNPRTCGAVSKLGLDQPAIERDMRDQRIRAIVSLDLGLARGFTVQSLESMTIPALVIGAGIDIGDLPVQLESGHLAEHLPETSSNLVVIDDAMHFSFLQLCKAGAVERIEAETPGEGIVCRDGTGQSRIAIHARVGQLISQFLARSLQVKQ